MRENCDSCPGLFCTSLHPNLACKSLVISKWVRKYCSHEENRFYFCSFLSNLILRKSHDSPFETYLWVLVFLGNWGVHSLFSHQKAFFKKSWPWHEEGFFSGCSFILRGLNLSGSCWRMRQWQMIWEQKMFSITAISDESLFHLCIPATFLCPTLQTVSAWCFTAPLSNLPRQYSAQSVAWKKKKPNQKCCIFSKSSLSSSGFYTVRTWFSAQQLGGEHMFKHFLNWPSFLRRGHVTWSVASTEW